MPEAAAPGRGASASTRVSAAILIGVAAVIAAWGAGRTWFPAGPALGYGATALLAALLPSRHRWLGAALGWLAVASCLLAAWSDYPFSDAPLIAALLALPVAASTVAVVRYVTGSPELLAVERKPRLWRRAAIATSIALTLGVVVWMSVIVGLRADRMDRVDETVDRINAGLTIIAEELVLDVKASPQTAAAQWRDELVHGALTTGRSLVVLGPAADGQREPLAAALWTDPPWIRIRFTDDVSEMPPALVRGAQSFARTPQRYQRSNIAWRYSADELPAARAIPESRAQTSGTLSGEFRVQGTWTDEDEYLLVSVSAAGDEWWNEQGRRDYLRSATVFFIWIDIALVTVSIVLMTALDSRSGLLASLHAERQRAALRRDAHDRVYNRLAAIAHSLETQEGDRAVGRNAAFEILSAVGYLQRILDGPQAGPVDRSDESGGLRRQLEDVCESAERLWGMRVSLTVEGSERIDPRSSWDIQCVVDEALSNAGEHGKAALAAVEVKLAGGRARIGVKDDGTWVGNAAASSTGLEGIRERIVERGGFLTVSHDESGTRVRAELVIGSETGVNTAENT